MHSPATDFENSVRERLLALGSLELQDPDKLAIRPIVNYGGFVNRSFKVTAGTDAYHLKLSSDAGSLQGLERWRSLNVRLADDYHAPALRGWIEIPGSGLTGTAGSGLTGAAAPGLAGATGTRLAGAVFDWIEGAPPAAVTGPVRRQAMNVVERLHTDHPLAAALARMGDPATSCAAAFRSTYHQRFVADLDFVRKSPPPFVSGALLDQLATEAESIAHLVDRSEAFAAPADAPSHRDLWLDNLLLSPGGKLYILDWDEMGLGDPMMDWAMLFGPARTRVVPGREQDLAPHGFSRAERERFGLYARASLLDWTIDPLADWVDAEDEPEHGAAVRASCRRVHEEALSLYRGHYW